MEEALMKLAKIDRYRAKGVLAEHEAELCRLEVLVQYGNELLAAERDGTLVTVAADGVVS